MLDIPRKAGLYGYAAERFLADRTRSDAPPLDAAMWELTLLCARSGAGIANETLASAALSEARLEVPPVKFDKLDFAPGIKLSLPNARWIWCATSEGGKVRARLMSRGEFRRQLSRQRLPSVGVLAKGGCADVE